MGYYVRVLSTGEIAPHLAALRDVLSRARLRVRLKCDQPDDAWDSVLVESKSGVAIASVERAPVAAGSLAAEELEEFREEIEDCEPASARAWLAAYFLRVRTIYAMQILSGARRRGDWQAIRVIQSVLWSSAPGIFQADGEGFSNEDGYHILWQFADDESGPRRMAVRRDDGWQAFEMDLGDPQQREAFLAGRVPPKAREIP